jgi:regulator of PEP synthase PpsR (kinase-PPPase family)
MKIQYPKLKRKSKVTCVVGLNTEPERLVDIRKNRMNSLKKLKIQVIQVLENIKKEIRSKKNF